MPYQHLPRLLLLFLATAASALAAPIDDLDWLAGLWRGTSTDGTTIESFYSSTEGGAVIGSSKEFKNGRCVFFDLELFRETDGKLLLSPHPNGQRSKDSFPLDALDQPGRKATFVNRQHDWPQVFIYQRVDDEHLFISLSGPGKDGKELKTDYTFTRVK